MHGLCQNNLRLGEISFVRVGLLHTVVLHLSVRYICFLNLTTVLTTVGRQSGGVAQSVGGIKMLAEQ